MLSGRECPVRVDIGRGDAGEDVLLDLADVTAADEVVLVALRELRSQFDRLLVDTEFFAQLAERRRGVVFPVHQRAAGRRPPRPGSAEAFT
ncbi:hypothetical protein GCM10010300_46330 [Streptomyces olivaceoviridis]|nr:hypothetical protein GCM10010300_46330 [Streptomyces olivaceoviridis]